MLQAYIDESIGGDILVLGGLAATADKWEAFSEEWAALVSWGGYLHSDGLRSFKMSQMTGSQDRLEKAPAFYRVIEKYVDFGISVKFRLSEFHRAKSSITHPHATVKIDVTPYQAAFAMLISVFHKYNDNIPEHLADGKIDFILDNIMDKKVILAEWEDFKRNRGENALRFGATPRFEDDRVFLPLQAADFWAWHVREWEESHKPTAQGWAKFTGWETKRHFPLMHISLSRAALTEALRNSQRLSGGGGFSVNFDCFP